MPSPRRLTTPNWLSPEEQVNLYALSAVLDCYRKGGPGRGKLGGISVLLQKFAEFSVEEMQSFQALAKALECDDFWGMLRGILSGELMVTRVICGCAEPQVCAKCKYDELMSKYE